MALGVKIEQNEMLSVWNIKKRLGERGYCWDQKSTKKEISLNTEKIVKAN